MSRSFADLAAFAAHLRQVVHNLPAGERAGMEAGAKLIREEARAELGHYQEAVGPFPAWPELADRTKADRKRLGFTEDDPLLRNGTLRDAIASTVDGRHAAVGVASATVGDGSPRNPTRDIGDVAMWMEVGTERAPPRPFLGPAAFKKGKDATRLIGRAVFNVITGRPPGQT